MASDHHPSSIINRRATAPVPSIRSPIDPQLNDGPPLFTAHILTLRRQSIRRSVLRSAASASASVRVAPSTATPLFRSVAQQSVVFRPAALALAARYFSQTARVANNNEISTENTYQEIAKDPSAPVEAPVNRGAIEETPYGIFIRNMVFDATEANLKEAFEHYGAVTSVAISRDPRGLSRG